MPGAIRLRAVGHQQLQPEVHGGHDGRVRAMPADGGPEAPVLQGNTVQRTEVPQHIGRP